MTNQTHTKITFDATITGSGGNSGITYSAGTFTNNRGCAIIATISWTLIFNTNSTGYRVGYVNATLSSVTSGYSVVYTNAVSIDTTCLTGSVTLYLANGDNFDIRGWQNSGGNLALTGNNTCTIFINDTA